MPSTELTARSATTFSYERSSPFTPTVDPLCTQTVCPKETGVDYNETSWSIFPSGVSGKVVSRIQWDDQDAQPLWCIETTWRVSED